MCDGRQHILENGLAYCVLAGSDGTSTVVPRRHATSFMSLISAEQNLCITLADRAIKHLKGQHESITDFDVRFDVPADHYSHQTDPDYTQIGLRSEILNCFFDVADVMYGGLIKDSDSFFD